MIIALHRINTIRELREVPKTYGVEVDVRGYGEKIILNHEPLEPGDELGAYLAEYHHRFIIFNVKEAGIEAEIHAAAATYGIRDYFLLDAEFPYIYRASRSGERRIAVRYSEDEPIEMAQHFRGKVDWVWIDTQTTLPLRPKVVSALRGYKTALVSPERFGRPGDVPVYLQKMRELNFSPDLVMTELRLAPLYEAFS